MYTCLRPIVLFVFKSFCITTSLSSRLIEAPNLVLLLLNGLSSGTIKWWKRVSTALMLYNFVLLLWVEQMLINEIEKK